MGDVPRKPPRAVPAELDLPSLVTCSATSALSGRRLAVPNRRSHTSPRSGCGTGAGRALTINLHHVLLDPLPAAAHRGRKKPQKGLWGRLSRMFTVVAARCMRAWKKLVHRISTCSPSTPMVMAAPTVGSLASLAPHRGFTAPWRSPCNANIPTITLL